MIVKEMRDMQGYWALQSYHKLLLGLKMLPSYLKYSYEEFFERVEAMDIEGKEKIIREAVLFVQLDKDEMQALTQFVCDPNGVPYTSTNMKSLKPDEIFEIIVAACMQIVNFKIKFVTEDEKKKSQISPLI